MLQTQRTATMRSLQDLTRLKRQTGEADLSWRLVLESMVFAAEAEIRWLDYCETALLRDAHRLPAAAGNAGGTAGPGPAPAAVTKQPARQPSGSGAAVPR